MTRHIRRASALLLASALFSAGAWGQTEYFRQSVTGMLSIASEYFGAPDGREVGDDVYGNPTNDDTVTPAPRLVLTYTGGTSISGGGEAEVTYTLEGATFAGTVPASAVTGADGANIASKRERGGTAGDVSVTFLVEATSDFSSGSAITFEVPLLNVTGAVLESGAGPDDPPEAVGVGITTSISSIRSTGTPLPLDVLGPDDNVDTTKPEEDEITYLQEQVYSTKDPALSFTWAWGETELVHVKDRKVIIKVGADATDPSDDTKAASAALRIGTIDVEPATGTIKDLGGEDAAVDASTRELGDGLSGDVDVTVYGRFQTGDEIYLGAKRMSITGGVATGDVDIEDLLENEKGGLKVVYVPGGVDDLRPTTFTGIGAMDFNDDDNSPDVVAVFAGLYGVTQGKLEFKGFSNQGYAYGVVPRRRRGSVLRAHRLQFHRCLSGLRGLQGPERHELLRRAGRHDWPRRH